MAEPELRKHVAAVHCSGVLSLLERKMFNVLLYQAYDELLTKPAHEIPIPVLCAMVGYNSNDYKPLKAALRNIRVAPIEFNLLEDGVERSWTTAGLIAEGTLERGLCIYSFSPRVAEKLFSPEIYLRINLMVQRQFRSSFSLNVFENCLRFRAVGSTGWWSIELFRKLAGAEAALYDNFNQLCRRVIKPAVKEINDSGEIRVVAEFDRAKTKGRPVQAIRFRITEGKQPSLFPTPDGNEEVREKEAYKLLRELGLADRAALAAVLQDEGNALAIAQHVKAGALAQKIKKPAAYAATMLERGAVLAPAPIEHEVAKRKAESRAGQGKLDREEKRRTLKVRFEAERRARAKALLTAELRPKLLEQWVAHEKGRNNEAALRGYSPETGELRAPASGMFEIFCTNQLLGAYTDVDLDAWIETRPAA